MNKLPYILLIIALGLIIYLIGYNVGLRKCEPQYITSFETDTITITDTLVIEKPVLKCITETSERVDTIIEYIKETDTIYVPFSLPIITKEYSDINYKASIKGVQWNEYPTLESLEIYQKENYITNTITTQQRANKWGLDASFGLGLSYDLMNRRFVPTIGVQVGIGYRITK